MAGLDDTISSVTSGAGPALTGFLIVIGVIVFILLIFGGFFFYWWTKKRWNLRVEVKLPRSDGHLISAEWAKGYYNAKRGVVLIKRKKTRAIAMPVFDIRKYLQGVDILTVLQVGPEDYRPVLNTSWETHEVEYEETDDKTGKLTGEVKTVKDSILNIKVDTGLNKAWKSAWEAAAKKAYSLQSFFNQFQTPIAIGIVLICTFAGFAIIWTRLGSIC